MAYTTPRGAVQKMQEAGADFPEKLIRLSGVSEDTTRRVAFADITPLSRNDDQSLANAPLAISEISASPPSTTVQEICIRGSGACAGSEAAGYLRDITGRQMNFPASGVNMGDPNPDGSTPRR